MLDGGFRSIAGAGPWAREHMWADTAPVDRDDLGDYIRFSGHRWLLFGFDFSFGDPYPEQGNMRSLNVEPDASAVVLGGHFSFDLPYKNQRSLNR
jgi:hypothetical protein